MDHHHFPAGLMGLHDAADLADLLEAEDPEWAGLETPERQPLGNLPNRLIGQRKLRSTAHAAAKEGQLDTAGHLQKPVEVGYRREAAQPARQAGATAAAQHVQGIENGAVADKVEHRIELLGFSDPL